jgi:two-component sensor histidine kinase
LFFVPALKAREVVSVAGELDRISDNGKGMGEDPSDGSGRKLVRALVDQVRGRFELTSSPSGATLMVRFFPKRATLPR